IVRLEGWNVREPVDGRCHQQQDQERYAQPVQDTMQVLPSLGQREPAPQERPIGKQSKLDRTEAPAGPLRDVLRQALGGEARAQSFIQAPGLITFCQQGVSQMDIFRDRLVRKSSDLGQAIAANDKGGANAECASPCILGRLKNIEEKSL